MAGTPKTIKELLVGREPYTRERFDADRVRIIARICEKHGIAEHEVHALVAEHRYQHDAEDIEDEYIQLMAWAHVTGWT